MKSILDKAKKELSKEKREANKARLEYKRKELAEKRNRNQIANTAYNIFKSLNGKKIRGGKIVVEKSEKFRWPFDICGVSIKYKEKDAKSRWLFSVGYSDWVEETSYEDYGTSTNQLEGIKISYEDYNDLWYPRKERTVEYRYEKAEFVKETEEWLVSFFKDLV